MSSSGAIEGDGASNGDVPLEPTGPPLLELRKLSKHFGAVQALTEIDLKVYAGKVTALVGDNGAGKSVTLKTIAGIHPPDGGQILLEGPTRPHQIAPRLSRPRYRNRLPGLGFVQQPRHCPEHVPRAGEDAGCFPGREPHGDGRVRDPG